MTAIIFDQSKRKLMRRDRDKDHTLLPWVRGVDAFIENCTRCGDCLNNCPEKIIELDEGGFPFINFKLGECTFCKHCVEVCEQPVFSSTETEPWLNKAHVSNQCLAFNSVYCRSCAEVCPEQALSFALAINAQPNIDNNKCNGCGACVAPCPANAISVEEYNVSK